jgi:hypothetical protein
MRELWFGQVHLLTPPAEFGDTKCVTNVVTWADAPENFTERVSAVFARRGWSIVSVYRCKPVAECAVMIEEVSEQIAEARMKPDSCIFGTLHYYPSRPL